MGLNYCNYFTRQLILTLVRTRTGAQRYLYSHSIDQRKASSTSTSTSNRCRAEYEYETARCQIVWQVHSDDETRARQYLVAASMADRIYSKPCSGFKKSEHNDRPKSSIVQLSVDAQSLRTWSSSTFVNTGICMPGQTPCTTFARKPNVVDIVEIENKWVSAYRFVQRLYYRDGGAMLTIYLRKSSSDSFRQSEPR